MKPFFGVQAGDLFIATTGYTGEAGYEIAMPNEQAADFWRGLLDAGVKPCGLGARHPAPEAGMNLYGRRWTKAFPAGGEHGLDYRTGARRS